MMPRLAANLEPMKWGGYMRSLRGKLKSAECESCLWLLRAQAAQAACPDTMQGRKGRLVAIGPHGTAGCRNRSVDGGARLAVRDQDGSLVLVTTYEERADQGFVDLLDASDLTRRTTVEVSGEPFHALPMQDGEHVLVALAGGETVKVHLGRGEARSRRLSCGWRNAGDAVAHI